MILCYSGFSDKIIRKIALRKIICLWVSLPNDPNWKFIFLMQQRHAKTPLSESFPDPQNFILPEKTC